MNDELKYRTYSGGITLDEVALFAAKHSSEILAAAKHRRNEVAAVRQACFRGLSTAMEIDILKRDMFACKTAFDVVKSMGLVTRTADANAITVAERGVYMTGRQARRHRVQANLDRL